jgi:hypothetical protein
MGAVGTRVGFALGKDGTVGTGPVPTGAGVVGVVGDVGVDGAGLGAVVLRNGAGVAGVPSSTGAGVGDSTGVWNGAGEPTTGAGVGGSISQSPGQKQMKLIPREFAATTFTLFTAVTLKFSS